MQGRRCRNLLQQPAMMKKTTGWMHWSKLPGQLDLVPEPAAGFAFCTQLVHMLLLLFTCVLGLRRDYKLMSKSMRETQMFLHFIWYSCRCHWNPTMSLSNLCPALITKSVCCFHFQPASVLCYMLHPAFEQALQSVSWSSRMVLHAVQAVKIRVG